jgi:hypothetical protein
VTGAPGRLGLSGVLGMSAVGVGEPWTSGGITQRTSSRGARDCGARPIWVSSKDMGYLGLRIVRRQHVRVRRTCRPDDVSAPERPYPG